MIEVFPDDGGRRDPAIPERLSKFSGNGSGTRKTPDNKPSSFRAAESDAEAQNTAESPVGLQG